VSLPAIDLSEVDYALFEGHVGQRYRVDGGNFAVDFLLADARRLGTPVLPHDRDPFSLLFVGPPWPRLHPGLYRVCDHDGRWLEMLIVPKAGDANTMQYEAVFS
jgi:hypothetical protein